MTRKNLAFSVPGTTLKVNDPVHSVQICSGVHRFSALAAFVERRSELSWVRPAGGAVAFPRLADGADADAFVRVAREEFEVGVVPGSLFGYSQSFRICLGCRSEILEGGLEALGKAVDKGTY